MARKIVFYDLCGNTLSYCVGTVVVALIFHDVKLLALMIPCIVGTFSLYFLWGRKIEE